MGQEAVCSLLHSYVCIEEPEWRRQRGGATKEHLLVILVYSYCPLTVPFFFSSESTLILSLDIWEISCLECFNENCSKGDDRISLKHPSAAATVIGDLLHLSHLHSSYFLVLCHVSFFPSFRNGAVLLSWVFWPSLCMVICCVGGRGEDKVPPYFLFLFWLYFL